MRMREKVMDDDVDLESCTTAEELLLKAFGKGNNVSLKGVTNVLASDVFLNDMMATCNGVGVCLVLVTV